MSLLPRIRSPRDLRRLTPVEVRALANEIRTFLIHQVSATGGHLGPNLGVVELTLAIHRVFDSPADSIVFDTGHQAYVHKLLTGRQDFSRLRKGGGLSGYPDRGESEHDVVENSHASTSLSWAHGIAQANALRGRRQHAVAVVGDGALTGGMAWEALNNIATCGQRLVIVVNDNGRSYAPTIGGMAHHLSTLRTTRGYERFLDWGRTALHRGGAPGKLAYDTLHGMKKGLKDVVAPQGLFEDLGLKYVGPVDGHDVEALEHALARAKAFDGPVIVHAMTRKGNGFSAAELDDVDRMHAVGVIDPDTGQSLAAVAGGPTWTSAFGEAVLEQARRRPDVVALTAAMLVPVGLERLAAELPDRVVDVGIAEQHAVTSAAGMAYAGLHPVVAVYSTFLTRALDQVLMDVALHRAGVTFVLDRAGITGPDGASHHGTWDVALLGVVPGLRLAAPRDGARLREALDTALDVGDGPTVLRFPKGAVGDDVPAIERIGADAGAGGGPGHPGVDVLARGEGRDVLVVAVGAMVGVGLDVARRLAAQGIDATVVDPVWALPVPAPVVELAREHRLVVTVEDGVEQGGVGSQVVRALAAAGVTTPVHVAGVPVGFHPHGSREEVLAAAGLTGQDVARAAAERVAGLDAAADAAQQGSVSRPS
jgi:1-deoxy-D-xylulose-5-phosphate synthase